MLFFMARVRTSVSTVRQLIDALSLALEKLIKQAGQTAIPTQSETIKRRKMYAS